ncbi:MAG: ABC transporter ATP-binding protein/permease [Armatimonadota bacterium]|nr:ABC transporter ATP-binding protein/permease [Armatimonadota bacterium]
MGSTLSSLNHYARLLHYAARHWAGWVLIIAVTLLSTGCAVLQPWPLKILVDHVLGQQPMPAELAHGAAYLPVTDNPLGLLTWVVLAGLGIFVLNGAVSVVLTWAWVRVGQRMVYDLADDLFARIQRRSLLFHSRNAVGDSMGRIMEDSWCLHTVVATLLFNPGYAVITIAGMVALMTRLNFELTMIALAVAPVMVWSSFLFGRSLKTAAKQQREAESRLQAHVQQTLAGFMVVQACAQEERESRRLRRFANAVIIAHQRSVVTTNFQKLGSGLCTSLGTAAVLWVGARLVFSGHLSIGSLLLFLSYLVALQTQMKAFTGMHSALQSAGASIDRVFEVLQPEQDVPDPPNAPALPPVRGHIRFENVTFGYEPDYPVLRDVSLEVQPGQTVAIVGPTGAGKSTLVSLVPRFFDPWQGRVTVDGHDLRQVRLRSVRSQASLVLQEPCLFYFTIAENNANGRHDDNRAEIEAAARAANAHDFIERLPEGYDTVLGERGTTLSGGERQRLAIARALLKDAPVLILDEPTSALDAKTERLLLEALERLKQGRTTFIIAHRLSTIRGADQIVVLKDGAIIETGTHAELLARNGLYSRLHRIQAGQRRRSFERRQARDRRRSSGPLPGEERRRGSRRESAERRHAR